MGEIKPYNCSAVKTPTALKLELSYVLNLLCLTTITILYLFCRIRFATCPMDVVVVTPGGGLLIIFQRGASNCNINKYLLYLLFPYTHNHSIKAYILDQEVRGSNFSVLRDVEKKKGTT